MIPEKTRFIIGNLIMKGVHYSGDEWQLWIEEVAAFIKSLNLPNRKCSSCTTEMLFFDWHMVQGYCDVCTEATLEEMREEDGYGEI